MATAVRNITGFCNGIITVLNTSYFSFNEYLIQALCRFNVLNSPYAGINSISLKPS